MEQKCTKYKPLADGGQAAYHQTPASLCQDCVYFSQKNCGLHPAATTTCD